MAGACYGLADWEAALAALTDWKLLTSKDQQRLLRDMMMFEATVQVYGIGPLKKEARESEVLNIFNTAVDELDDRDLPKGTDRAELKRLFRAKTEMTGASIVTRANVLIRPRCYLRA